MGFSLETGFIPPFLTLCSLATVSIIETHFKIGGIKSYFVDLNFLNQQPNLQAIPHT